jgi:nitroreductase
MDLDHALVTTRAVRRRLDLDRPVPRAVVLECLQLALQAPNGSNTQPWRWVVIDDPALREGAAAIYRGAIDSFANRPGPRDVDYSTPAAQRIATSVAHLKDNLHRVPVLVVPVVKGRLEGEPLFMQASRWGSILPAVWSFMLALRARGLGSAWTTIHLHREQEMAELLGIPHGEWTQAGLFPVAYTLGSDFHAAPRGQAEDVVSWNTWGTAG